MSEWDDREPDRPRDPTEGVRIIGPDEAAEAAERGDVRRRRSDRPRYRDRPVEPPSGRPRPSLRFPLDASADPDQIERPPVAPVERHRPPTEVSHWAASALEEVPNMSPRDPYEGDEAAAWSTFAGTGPRWRDDEPNRRGEPVTFDEYADPAPGRSVFGESTQPADPPSYEDAYERGYDETDYGQQAGYADRDEAGYADRDQAAYAGQDQAAYAEQGYDERYDDVYDDSYDDVYAEPNQTYVDSTAAPSRPAPRSRRPSRPAADRDMKVAVGVGVGMVVAALVVFQLGTVATMVLVIAVLGVASYEYFGATQRAGFDPLMPVGVTATVGAVVAAYNYGESAIPLILVLSVAVCLIWYLIDAGGERPMANLGATLLGICWIGLFGSFAGLLLAGPNGIALLAAAIIPTIGYDVGALFVGKSTGSRPLSEASPNKTVEGLVGGMVLAVVAGLLLAVIGPDPFDSIGEGLRIGLVAAVAAPLGDLSESLIKRDLGIKDMGGLIPGHGGVLDRFDALLFVLPAIWYAARLSDFFVQLPG